MQPLGGYSGIITANADVESSPSAINGAEIVAGQLAADEEVDHVICTTIIVWYALCRQVLW